MISFAAGVVVLVDAFKNGGLLHGLLALFLPFYALYWFIFRMKENRGLVVGGWVVGLLLMIAPVLPGLMHASSAVSEAKAAADRDVCTLLTADQVGAELHEAFDPGESSTSSGNRACNYRDSASATHKLVVVSQPCTSSRLSQLSLGENDYPVQNLGDQAVYSKGVLITRQGLTCIHDGS